MIGLTALNDLKVMVAQQSDALSQGEDTIETLRAQLTVVEASQVELTDEYQTLKLAHRELTANYQSQSIQLESLQASNQDITQRQQQQQQSAKEMLISQRDMIASLGEQLTTLLSRKPGN